MNVSSVCDGRFALESLDFQCMVRVWISNEQQRSGFGSGKLFSQTHRVYSEFDISAMFRKLQDRISSAAHSAWNSWSESDSQRLQSLGFSEVQARSALESCNGNVDQAANLLITGSLPNGHSIQASTPIESEEDAQLRQAMDASRIEMEQQQQSRRPPTRTAAMNKAAEAALRRHEAPSAKKTTKQSKDTVLSATQRIDTATFDAAAPTTIPRSAAVLRDYHPDVKLIPKLQDKSTEEQILRTADRLRTFPAAVDVLYKVLTTLRDDPVNPKYQRLSCQTAGYQKTIQPAVGAEDFLRAMRFYKDSQQWILQGFDAALLYLGISALEQTMATTEYIDTKKQQAFEKQVCSLLDATVTAEEHGARASHLRRCPSEPQSGALVTIELSAQNKIQRRFDGDDTVEDMLHWLASACGTAIYEKVAITKEWNLMDRNQKVLTVIDTTKQHLTLQFVGCWPSGRLALTHQTPN